MAQQDYARAILQFRNAQQAMPGDAEPYYQLGLAYLATRNFPAAAGALRKATELNPKHEAAQLKLSELMLATRDKAYIAEATDRLSAVLGNSPRNVEAIDRLALGEWELGKAEAATNRLEEALRIFPTHLSTSVTLAEIKLSQQDLPGAEQVLKAAVAAAPESSPAALALGQLYILLRDPAKAEAQIQRALTLDPKSGPALSSLAAIQISGSRLEDADATFRRLAALPDAKYKTAHAAFLYRSGKREAAIQELESLFKANTNDRRIRTLLVSGYFTLNKLSEAQNTLNAALKRNPKDVDALLQRSELYLKSSRVRDAENDLQTVLHLTPDSAEAYFNLARVNAAQGLTKAQQEHLTKALQLNPRFTPARLSLARSLLRDKNPQMALDLLDQAPDREKHLLAVVLERNWALLQLGNLQAAKEGIAVVFQSARLPEAMLQDAVLKMAQRDYSGARETAEQLLKQDPAQMAAAGLIAEAYAREKQIPKAVDRLKQLAVAQPKSAPLQHLLGIWSARAGNAAEARKAFEAAKSLDPQFRPAVLSLAQLDLQQGQNDSARQALSTMQTWDPNDVTALLLLAEADGRTGDREDALKTYRAVLDIDASNLVALNNLAYYLAAEDPDEALRFAQRAVEIAPDSANVQDTLGYIYLRRGMYSMAAPHLKTAVERESSPARQYHLGVCYLKMGDRTSGLPLVREALAKEPNLAKEGPL